MEGHHADSSAQDASAARAAQPNDVRFHPPGCRSTPGPAALSARRTPVASNDPTPLVSDHRAPCSIQGVRAYAAQPQSPFPLA